MKTVNYKRQLPKEDKKIRMTTDFLSDTVKIKDNAEIRLKNRRGENCLIRKPAQIIIGYEHLDTLSSELFPIAYEYCWCFLSGSTPAVNLFG